MKKEFSIGVFICITVVIIAVLLLPDQLRVPTKALSGDPFVHGSVQSLLGEFKEAIEVVGPEATYVEFKEVYGDDEGGSRHALAHLFGEALYGAEGVEGFAFCDSDFEFGCYHGFLGIAVAVGGAGILPSLDVSCKERWGSGYLPCQHGIGHGILAYLGEESLLDALDLCTTISWQPTGGCSSGVFMEYNFKTMDDPTGQTVRSLEADPYTPCSTLRVMHQPSCYFEQVQWWESVYQDDYRKIGLLCGGISKNEFRTECYRGMGNFIGPFTKGDVRKTVSMCEDIPDESGVYDCLVGASWIFKTFPDVSVEQRKYICEKLTGVERRHCYE